MTKHARWVWEVEIPDKPTEEDMEKAMRQLKNTIESYISNRFLISIEDIEICDTAYEIWGEQFKESKQ